MNEALGLVSFTPDEVRLLVTAAREAYDRMAAANVMNARGGAIPCRWCGHDGYGADHVPDCVLLAFWRALAPFAALEVG